VAGTASDRDFTLVQGRNWEMKWRRVGKSKKRGEELTSLSLGVFSVSYRISNDILKDWHKR